MPTESPATLRPVPTVYPDVSKRFTTVLLSNPHPAVPLSEFAARLAKLKADIQTLEEHLKSLES